MSALALLYVTFGSAEDARRIVTTILDERLAACANIGAPCTAIYRWEGAIAEAAEVPVLFKTRPTLAARLAERIAALHPYELPVIERWSGEVSGAVTAWVARETA